MYVRSMPPEVRVSLLSPAACGFVVAQGARDPIDGVATDALDTVATAVVSVSKKAVGLAAEGANGVDVTVESEEPPQAAKSAATPRAATLTTTDPGRIK